MTIEEIREKVKSIYEKKWGKPFIDEDLDWDFYQYFSTERRNTDQEIKEFSKDISKWIEYFNRIRSLKHMKPFID